MCWLFPETQCVDLEVGFAVSRDRMACGELASDSNGSSMLQTSQDEVLYRVCCPWPESASSCLMGCSGALPLDAPSKISEGLYHYLLTKWALQ
jgi:hypothetical protein